MKVYDRRGLELMVVTINNYGLKAVSTSDKKLTNYTISDANHADALFYS